MFEIDADAWFEARTSGGPVFFQIFFATASLVAGTLAVAKLTGFIRAYGPQLSVPQLCLVLQILCNMERLVFFVLDTAWIGRNIISSSASHLQVTSTWPFEFITNFLIALYWQEVIQTKTQVTQLQFVARLKVPFIIVSVILLVVDWVLSGRLYLHIVPDHHFWRHIRSSRHCDGRLLLLLLQFSSTAAAYQ
jgi:hypothetical protein